MPVSSWLEHEQHLQMLSFQDCVRTQELSHFQKGISGPEVIKLFVCSTQLGMNFIMLIYVKMPTVVGILTFISMINTVFESECGSKRGLHFSTF